MIITVVSKDKISLSMFVDFYKTLYDSNTRVVDLNMLNSSDVLNAIVKSTVGDNVTQTAPKDSNIIIKLKTKRSLTINELPTEIARSSFYIIQFDLYSTKPEVLKARDSAIDPILARWEANIEKMNSLV
jgi:hypothetical protein